ncbi:MAG: cobalt-precorrin hydrolase [Candidatus Petromonas sp.]|jgi:cobalt-precorrin 5A hydrolase|nr:cobalt-precorrin hydrolase [Candidatus Petromonas sp.]
MDIEGLKMSKAIITLTRGAAELGLKLMKEYRDAVLYINKKFDIKGDNIHKIENDIKDLISNIFNKYDCLIFIMATGIVVRTIAPHLRDKMRDPAVVVLDEKGRHVISLLSGHLGRANEYTLDIAERINGNPVITTASDVNNTLAIDTMAMKLNCRIEDLKKATKVTAHIVNGEKVGIISEIQLNMDLPDNLVIIGIKEELKYVKGLIYITNKDSVENMAEDTVVLRPPNLVVGIGCRKGKRKEEIVRAVKESLKQINRSPLSIKHIATIDVKKDENGIKETADYFKVPLVIIDSKEVKKIENNFQISSFVKKSIGVGAVSEPVAVLSSNGGKLVLNKTKYDGITVAVVEEGEV